MSSNVKIVKLIFLLLELQAKETLLRVKGNGYGNEETAIAVKTLQRICTTTFPNPLSGRCFFSLNIRCTMLPSLSFVSSLWRMLGCPLPVVVFVCVIEPLGIHG